MVLTGSFFDVLIQQLHTTSIFEWVGLLTTLACIYLAARENIWNWPVSIIAIVISAVIYFRSQLFGDFILQFYFLFTAFYGWYYWLKKQKEPERPIARLKRKEWIWVAAAIIILSPVLGYLLDEFTPTNVPYEDGACTAISFVAQVMLTRKILENWILWIIVDILYVPLLLYKGLNVYAVLYGILVLIALKGYIDWKRTYAAQGH